MPLHASSTPTIPLLTSIKLPCCMAGIPNQPSNSITAAELTRVKDWITGASMMVGQGTATEKNIPGKQTSKTQPSRASNGRRAK